MPGIKNATQTTHSDVWKFRQAPALVAHRGFAKLFPENTLIAIAAAVDAGARFIEFDIQLSKDHVPFLMHDDNFRRTAGVDKSVFDLTMSEIRELNVGEPERLGCRFHDVYPITLEHFCDHLSAWPDIHSFVEIKRQSVEQFGLETTMRKVTAAMASLQAPCSIISFREDVVEWANKNTELSTAWVIRDWNQTSLDTLARLAPEFVFCDYHDVPDDFELPGGPWHWVLYEVTDVDVARNWQQRGVAMIESMAVSTMLTSPLYDSGASS